jgi:DNA-binding response OmpR family regulator
MKYILFAEDDDTLRNGLKATFESEGYETRGCRDGDEVLAEFRARRPDLLLLDVMMPGKSGYDVCAEVRRTDPQLPILFLTAKTSEADCVIGLGLGADDFIAKPFRIRELLARVSAALRRSSVEKRTDADNVTFRIGEATIDANRFLIHVPGEPEQALTVRELGLLKAFAANPGKVMTRDALLDAVWGENYFAESRTLDQHILLIRRKLGASGACIETIRGAGYRLKA